VQELCAAQTYEDAIDILSGPDVPASDDPLFQVWFGHDMFSQGFLLKARSSFQGGPVDNVIRTTAEAYVLAVHTAAASEWPQIFMNHPLDWNSIDNRTRGVFRWCWRYMSPFWSESRMARVCEHPAHIIPRGVAFNFQHPGYGHSEEQRELDSFHRRADIYADGGVGYWEAQVDYS